MLVRSGQNAFCSRRLSAAGRPVPVPHRKSRSRPFCLAPSNASFYERRESFERSPGSVLAQLLAAMEVRSQWLQDQRLVSDFHSLGPNTAAVAAEPGPSHVGDGNTTAGLRRIDIDRWGCTLVLPRLAEELLDSSGMGVVGVHRLLFHLVNRSGHQEVSAGSLGEADGVIQKIVEHYSTELEAMKEISECSSAFHVRLMALICAQRYLKSEGSLLDVVKAELAKADCAFPVDVLCGLLKTAPGNVCDELLQFQYVPVSSTKPDASPRRAVPAAPRTLVQEQLSTFLVMLEALLSNSDFSSEDEQRFLSMHKALMSLASNVVICKESVFASSSSPEHRHSPQSPSASSNELPRFLAALVRLSRVYATHSHAVEFGRLHRSLFGNMPWLRPLVPFRYLMWGMGMQLDASATQSRANSAEGYWGATLTFLEEGLSVFTKEEEVQEMWVMVSKTARHLPVPSVPSFFMLLDANQLFKRYGHESRFDYNGVRQLLRLMDLAMASPQIVRATPIIERTMNFLAEQLHRMPYSLIECCTAMLSYLKDRESQPLPRGVEDAPEAAALLYRCLKEILGTIGPGFSIEKMAHIRQLLEHFGAVPKALYWWTCGCGSKNVDESDRCTNCMRSLAARGENADGGETRNPRGGSGACAWICPSCHSRQQRVCDTCRACGAMHPNRQELELWQEKCATETLLRESGKKRKTVKIPASFICEGCQAKNKGSAINCSKCGTINPSFSFQQTAVVRKVWQCTGCQGYNYDIFSTCGTCRPVKTKPITALSVRYFAWRCGCGATNPCIRATCHRCSTKHNAWTCPHCKERSHARRVQQFAADGYTIRLISCDRCGFEQPRDRTVLDTAGLSTSCTMCAHPQQYCAEPCDQNETAGGDTSQTTAGPLNSDGGSLCIECQSALHNPWVMWRCSGCDKLTRGFRCTKCDVLAPAAQSAFLWRCDRLFESESVEGQTESTAAGASSSQLCGHWNPSWEGYCQRCHERRLSHPTRCDSSSCPTSSSERENAFTAFGRVEGRDDTITGNEEIDRLEAEAEASLPAYRELRCRYLPWQCPDCGTKHKANVILACPCCETGYNVPPPCPLCGLSHLTLDCPSPELLRLAQAVAKAAEEDM